MDRRGITLCIDTLEPLSYIESLLADMGNYIDYSRIGWGLNFLLDEGRLKRRIELYHESGVQVCTGGTAFFIAFKLGRVEEFFQHCERVGFDFVEIAEGVDLIEGIERCRSTGFGLMAEVGRKESDYEFTLEEELPKIEEVLERGVEFAVIEGRADGAAGIYGKNGRLTIDPVGYIKDRAPLEKVIIEAPRVEQQIYFINKYGPELNFGNVRLKDAATLESLRRGLKYDTRELLGEESLWLER